MDFKVEATAAPLSRARLACFGPSEDPFFVFDDHAFLGFDLSHQPSNFALGTDGVHAQKVLPTQALLDRIATVAKSGELDRAWP